MKKKEFKKLIEKEFEEIGFVEYKQATQIGEFVVNCEDGNAFFKPKEQYPRNIFFNDSIKILLEAVEYFKKTNKW